MPSPPTYLNRPFPSLLPFLKVVWVPARESLDINMAATPNNAPRIVLVGKTGSRESVTASTILAREGLKYSSLRLLLKLLPKLVRKHPGIGRGESFSLLTPQGSLTPSRAEHHLQGNQPMSPGLLSWASHHCLGPETGPPHRGRAENHGIGQVSVWEISHEVAEMNWGTRA